MSKHKSQSDKYYNLANKEKNKQNYDLAIEYYIKGNNVACLIELGNLYEGLGRFDDAIDCHKKILAIDSNFITTCKTLNQIGVCYSNQQKYKSAIEYFERVLQLKNDIPDVYNNISLCYFRLREFKLSELNCYKSLKIVKNNNTLKSLGDIYFWTKQYELAIQCYKKTTDFDKNDKTKYNCSFPYLAQKKFTEGYLLYENRLETNGICEQTKQKMRVEIPMILDWDGVKECSRLLVIYEQGIGDNIQHYRYIIELSKLYPNMKISYFCKDIVQGLFKEYDNIRIVKDLIIYEYDYKLFIMSLPHVLKINKIMPNEYNYINVNSNKVDYWRNELSSSKKYKVGLTFKGLLSSIIEKNIPIGDLDILFNSDIELICLHKLNEIDENEINKFKDRIKFVDIDNDVPFEDTIAILQNIDLLITVDTYIVHLAGILNVKTIMLLGYVSDWRWFNSSVCDWYNSVEILRMKENKALKYILPEVKKRLDEIMQIS
jgi:tetratricopeptide (TPR) repeat protein